MQSSIRPGAAGGLARACVAAGAAAAIVSIMPGPSSAPVSKASGIPSRAVALTASWGDVIATAQDNATEIWQHFSPAPFVALQQQIVNQIGYVHELITGTGSLQDVVDQIQANVTAVFGSPATGDGTAAPGALFGPFLPAGGATDTLYQSLDDVVRSTGTGLFGPGLVFLTHEQLDGLLNSLLPDLLSPLGLSDSDLPAVQAVFDLLGAPASGLLMGEIGTMLSPALQFNDDITAIADALSAAGGPDWATASQDLLGMPADVANAFLNGYGDVDLLPILDQLGITLPLLSLLGQDATIDALAVNLGGLLSGGGSVFDSLGLEVDLGALGSFDLPGIAVGPLASMVELGQAIAEALGWDGTGAPLDLMGALS